MTIPLTSLYYANGILPGFSTRLCLNNLVKEFLFNGYTVDLLVLTSSDQLLFIVRLYFSVPLNNPPKCGGQPY